MSHTDELKIASFGQVIMQATRPSVLIAPLQIGLHHFASKFLIHIPKLSNLKQTLQHFKEQIYLAVADNVDHNVTTLHGFNIFPGMGIIATMTLGTFEDIQTCTTDVY